MTTTSATAVAPRRLRGGPDHAAYLGSARLPFLDGIRALAALRVFVVHLGTPLTGVLATQRGVTVFFVLSGYLVTRMCSREERRQGSVDYRSFVIRRALRILPLYYLALAASVVGIVVLHLADRGSVLLRALPWYLVMLPEHAWRNLDAPFGLTWSLGVEAKFYVVWPLVAFVLLRQPRHRAMVAAAVVAVCGATTVLDPSHLGVWLGPYASLGLGCLASLALDDPTCFRALWLVGYETCLKALAVVVVVLAFGPPRLLSLYAAAVTLLLIGLVHSSGWGIRALSSRPLVGLGLISYPFFLFHAMLLNVPHHFVDLGGGWDEILVVAVLSLAITIPLCLALHRWVEEPCIRLGRRITARARLRTVAL